MSVYDFLKDKAFFFLKEQDPSTIIIPKNFNKNSLKSLYVQHLNFPYCCIHFILGYICLVSFNTHALSPLIFPFQVIC